MKVLFCTNAFSKVDNGPAKFAQLLHKQDCLEDLDVRILTEDVGDPEEEVYPLALNIPGYLKPFGQFIRMWKYYQRTMKIKKDFPFDIVVYNNAFIGLYSSLFFKKTVGMINDDSNAFVSITSVFKGRERLSKRIVFHYIERIFCKLSRSPVIVNSHYLRDKLSSQYNVKAVKFKVLHKAIELELINQNREDLIKNKIGGSVLFVKTDFNRGGIWVLVEAIKILGIPLKLGVVGLNEKAILKIKKELEGLRIEMDLFKYLPPKSVHNKMKEYEIFCVPSYKEAFGVANLEGLSCGCKVVTTNVGGIPEAMGGNPHAWLVPPGNAVALANALRVAFDFTIDTDSILRIDRYLKDFSSEVVISKFKNILSDVC